MLKFSINHINAKNAINPGAVKNTLLKLMSTAKKRKTKCSKTLKRKDCLNKTIALYLLREFFQINSVSGVNSEKPTSRGTGQDNKNNCSYM